MSQPLKLLSAATVDRLLNEREANLDRYSAGDFSDIERESGWAIETTVARWDSSLAAELDPAGAPEAEIKNSLLIYRGLEGMTPALARDERIWARLCHVECLQYARKRWLRGGEKLGDQVRLHFFAPGFTGCRDDNAIGRLWWNGHIAALACPDDIEFGLKRLLARANIRLQVIDRADTAFRQPLLSGIVRLLDDEWFTTYDAAVADFMFEVNKRSGGIIFEALKTEEIDIHLGQCLGIAKARRTAAAPA
ncbi:DUF6339 family protein [Variovorax ginsengisoli]|uniref:DUF6339 family protein n=1 Tax=Variovorax ginsengisoli TaxID=363844 RepID=A0ABT8SC30_9BURK|nr:DUF6339 family protein [Variovorax ginsengisoli]MDN8617301.1 DUF6339 family protein [Variovorax ginsengisoli]MDO1536471.1 DUF6339 family protein [Variovorax ginsengisoli]